MLRAVSLSVVLAFTVSAQAQTDEKKLIASAESSAPGYVTEGATIMTVDGKVLREGSNGWTCFAESPQTGPMCNQAGWGEFMQGFMNKQPVKVTPRGEFLLNALPVEARDRPDPITIVLDWQSLLASSPARP